MPEHFLSSTGADLFRPFTGRHRAIFFEVVTELYERTLGVNADYDIVLDRHRLNDIIVGTLSTNKELIFRDGDRDADLDDLDNDREYADRVRKRLRDHGVLEDYNDAAHLKVLWRFTPHGKRIAKMFSETRRKTSLARQRGVRSCKAALESFVANGNQEFLVDAYEYAASIFDDVTQIADLFADHQRRIMAHRFASSREAVEGYLQGVRDFEKRAARYFDSDNIYNHASDIIDLANQIDNLDTKQLAATDRLIADENPALEDEAKGEPLHRWMLQRIRRIVESTRDIKHEELHRSVGEFSTKYAVLIGRLIKLSASQSDDPIVRFAGIFGSADDAERDRLARELAWHLLPLRADVTDPNDIKLVEPAPRRRTPTTIVMHEPSPQDRLQALLSQALTEAFAISSGEVLNRVARAVDLAGGSTSLLSLPVADARQLLAALSAVEAIRSGGSESSLSISRSGELRSNGVFLAADHKISERA